MKIHINRKNIRGAAFVALALAALALLPGCANDENTPATGQGTLSVILGGITEGESETVTRAQAGPETVTQQLGDGLVMAYTLTPDAKSKTKATSAMTIGNKYKLVVLDGANNIVGSVDGVAGTQTPTIQVADGTYTVVAYSYNDNSSTLPDPGSVGAAAGSITAPAGTDLLYSSQSVTVGGSESKVVPVTFSRKASQVKVVVDASSLAENVTAASGFTLAPSYATTLDLPTGTVAKSGTSTPVAISFATLGTEAVTGDSTALFSNGETPLTLAIGSLTIGGITYTNKSVTFTRALAAGNSYTLTVNAHTRIPNTIELAQSQKYPVASIYDQDYVPFTTPTAAATTATAMGDGTNEAYTIDFQGSITTAGITVQIPVTATASDNLPAYSTTITVPSSLTQDGISQNLNLSWAS